MTTDGFNSVGWIRCELLSLSCNNPIHERVCPVAVELEAEAPKGAGAAGIARKACAAWPRGGADAIFSPCPRPTPAIPWGSAGHPISAIESPSQSRGPAGVPSSTSVVLDRLQGSGASAITHSMNTPRRINLAWVYSQKGRCSHLLCHRGIESWFGARPPALPLCTGGYPPEGQTKHPIIRQPNSWPRLRLVTHIPDVAERRQGRHAKGQQLRKNGSNGQLCSLSTYVSLPRVGGEIAVLFPL